MISFIIITKNEEKNIIRCLNSIESAMKYNKIDGYEEIVVDSASEDNTIKIVKGKENVRIINLDKSNIYFTAAMGRNIGALYAKYDLICFLDADMSLRSAWIKTALKLIKNCDGLIGEIKDIDENTNIVLRNRYRIKETKRARTLGGAFFVKKEVLYKVGNYNPYIKINEENELYSRILKYKYKIIVTTEIMADHYTPNMSKLSKLKMIIRHDDSLGRALAFKYSFLNESTIYFISLYKLFFLGIIIDFIILILLIFGIKIILILELILIMLYLFNGKLVNWIIDKIFAIKFFIGLFYRHKDFVINYNELDD